jgi:hypothetical protein
MHRPDAEPAHGAELVQSLDRGLAVIRAFDPPPAAHEEPGGTADRADQRRSAAPSAHVLSQGAAICPSTTSGLGISRTGPVDP